MNPLPFDACTVFAAGAFLLITSVSCVRAAGQEPADPVVQALLAKIDAARGKFAKADQALTIEGTYSVSFENQPGAAPAAKGGFQAWFAGADARQKMDMGPLGAMENGATKDLVWGLDPMMGPKVERGESAAAARRQHGFLRGVSPRDLYKSFELTGKESIDGREHTVVRMIPAEGKPDVWYVDATGFVTRIDTWLPAPESADAAFGMSDMMESQMTFADWKDVGGVRHPFKRTLRMGPATVTTLCTKVELPAKIDPATFTPPEAVLKVKLEPVETAFNADGTVNYQVVDRQAQAVASIRVKCKAAEISATLAILLPEVMAHLNAVGATIAGAPFSRYHAFDGDEVDIEAGLPVRSKVTDKGRVKNSELPAGKTVTAWHIGPYDKLGAAHAALQAHLAEKKLKARGGCWEIYWTDPGMVPDPEKWKTQLFAPVE